MKVDLLSGKHPTHCAEVWARYDALYRGGEVFEARVEEFLPRNPDEPDAVYAARKKEAHYCGYVGPIVDWFAAKLFAAPLTIRLEAEGDEPPPSSKPGASTRPAAEPEVDPFYHEFKEDCDGAGTDLVDFMRMRFTAACVKGRSWWLVELPASEGERPANLAQWRAAGLGRARLVPIDNEQVLDWEADDSGELLWAIVHSVEIPRPSPLTPRGRIRETWRIYDRAEVTTYRREYDPQREQPPDDAAQLGSPKKHGFTKVPLVPMGFVSCRGVKVKIAGRPRPVAPAELEGFWLLARLASPQRAHFRTSSALDWNVKRTCYAMPIFKVVDAKNPPTMGAGYYNMIGIEEDMVWAAPPTAHLSVMVDRVETLKDEIYRVANQLGQSVNNNAAAVGRSGESKQADAEAAEVVLKVFGAVARDAIERTMDLVIDGRADELEACVEGLDTFNTGDAATLAPTIAQVLALSIPSPTLRRRLFQRLGEVMLPGLSESDKGAIREEIENGVSAEETLNGAAGGDEEPPEVDNEETESGAKAA